MKWSDCADLGRAFLCVYFSLQKPQRTHLLFPCGFPFLQIFLLIVFTLAYTSVKNATKNQKSAPVFVYMRIQIKSPGWFGINLRRRKKLSPAALHFHVKLMWRRFPLLYYAAFAMKPKWKRRCCCCENIYAHTIRRFGLICIYCCHLRSQAQRFQSERVKKLPRAGWGQWPGNELETLIVASKTKRKIWRGNGGEKYFYAYIMRLKKRERNHTSFRELQKRARSQCNYSVFIVSSRRQQPQERPYKLTQLRIYYIPPCFTVTHQNHNRIVNQTQSL